MANLMPTHKLLRPIASCLAVVVLFGAGQVLAHSENDDLESVRVGGHHIGDAFDYRLERTYDDGDGSIDSLRFNWATGEPLRLPTGLEAEVQELQLIQQEGVGDDTVVGALRWIVDRGSARLLAYGEDFDFHLTGISGPVPIPVASSGTADADLRAINFADGRPLCYFGGMWANRTVAPGDRLAMPACAGLIDHDAETSFLATRFEDVDGHRALRLDAAEGPTMWLADGLPYPLAIRETIENVREPVLYELTLSGFQAGTVGPGEPVQHRAVNPAMPGVRMSPPTRIFVDDSMVQLPFTLTDALLGPTGLGSSPQVAAFFVQNPTAAAVTAQSQVGVYQGVVNTQWIIYVQDSDTGILVVASKATPVGTPRPAALALPALVMVRDGPVLPVSGLPTQAPRIDDLVARFAWHGGQGFGTYGYFAPGSVFVGHDEGGLSYDVEPPALTSHSVVRVEKAHFEFDGTTRSLLQADLQTFGRTEPTLGVNSGPKAEGNRPLVAAGIAPWPATAGIGAVAAVGGLLVWLLFGLKSSPLLGLFSRLREDELADHPMRRRILDAVAAQPGIHLKELGRVTGIPNGSLVHHSRRLADAGLVTVRKGNGYSCYFLGQAQAQAHGSAAALKSEGARKVLSAIAHRPNLSALDVERQTGLSPATVHHHLRRLTEAGLVRQQRNGRSLSLEATWAAKSALVS